MSCLVCRQQSGEIPVPGGVIDDDPLTVSYHRPPGPSGDVYAGHLLVTSRRHAPDLAALSPDEAAAVGRSTSAYARALRQVGAARVYTMTIGHGVEHMHVHVVPRWPGTPDAVPWHAVDEWAGARRLPPADVEALVARLRTLAGRLS